MQRLTGRAGRGQVEARHKDGGRQADSSRQSPPARIRCVEEAEQEEEQDQEQEQGVEK